MIYFNDVNNFLSPLEKTRLSSLSLSLPKKESPVTNAFIEKKEFFEKNNGKEKERKTSLWRIIKSEPTSPKAFNEFIYTL